MKDLQLLKTKLDTGHPTTGPYDADAATALQQMTLVNRPGLFPPKDIPKLLFMRGKCEAGERIRPILMGFDDIDYDDANHLLAISNGMDWLIGLSLASADDKTAVLALNLNRQSHFDEIKSELGASRLLVSHIEAARNLP